MDSPAERRPFWLRRLPWVLLLLAAAFAYYGSYYRHGINFRDEGGTITLLGKRVADGQVPFNDLVLGYNVGWFFPIAGLFKITGPNFVILRLYFFALSTLAAILGFLTVERAARHAGLRGSAILLAMLTGLILIATPGMTFKNYDPLAAVANTWCLLGFVLAMDAREARRRAFIGGLVLGATWLVRIDLGTFFTVIWFAAIVAILFERAWHGRGRIAILSLGLLILGVLLPHVPVMIDAMRRDYLRPFTAAYPNEWVRMGQQLQKLTGGSKPAPPAKASASPKANPASAVAATDPAPAPKAAPVNTDTLARPGWQEFRKGDWRARAFIVLMYLPLLGLIPIALWAAYAWVRAVARGSGAQTPLAALVLAGGALTLFPQYYFWRPDSPHLSEFGPGYWTAALGSLALLGVWGVSWRSPSRWLLIFLVIHAAIWLPRMLTDRWCGTIDARGSRKVLFEGENGVRVFEQARTVEWLTQVQKIVKDNSTEADYLVAWPYHPAFNVITNRPTYEANVYIDNATASARWSADAIARLKDKKPKIVILSGWAINGHEASRFKNWAAPVDTYIRANYTNAGAFGDKKDGTLREDDTYEVFVRKPEGAPPRP
jgi:hypothetical protein